jgi:putative flippase GtrA
MRRESRQRFLRFCVVGCFGFAVDGGLVYLLVSYEMDPYLVRAVSFPIAVSATWYLNRHWAFGIASSTPGKGRDYRRYLAVQTLGALANYLVYALLLVFLSHTAPNALAALAVGSLAGLVINYSGARWWVFDYALTPDRAGRYD